MPIDGQNQNNTPVYKKKQEVVTFYVLVSRIKITFKNSTRNRDMHQKQSLHSSNTVYANFQVHHASLGLLSKKVNL